MRDLRFDGRVEGNAIRGAVFRRGRQIVGGRLCARRRLRACGGKGTGKAFQYLPIRHVKLREGGGELVRETTGFF